MRVCPKCGYEDPPCWRNNPHTNYTQYCHLEELEVWDKALAEEIKKTRHDITKDGYIYHLTKTSNHVKRIAQKDAKSPLKFGEPDQESGRPAFRFYAKNQSRLLEVSSE